MIAKKIIQDFISAYNGVELANDLCTYIEKLESIETKIKRLRQDYRAAEEVYKRRREELKKQEKEIQNTCPHSETTYHGDPAGGSDSYSTCDICGKEF